VQLGIDKPCREEPKHRDNNVCNKFITGTSWFLVAQEEPGRTEAQKQIGAFYRFAERFGTFEEYTKPLRKEEERSKKKKIMICHKKTCFVGF
jgi:hypothetical protein